MSASVLPHGAVPVGRLAPSPTGNLHLGHARTFLIAWWHIRARAGRVLLRIEDLDGPRVEERFIERARFDLEWLGLDWDGPVVRQSESKEPLQAALAQLLEQGNAYYCVCSRSDIRAAMEAPHAGTPEPRYPGTCRGRYRTLEEAERASGKAVGLRFRVPAGSIEIDDAFAGPRAFDVDAEVGDFLIARRDGSPAYQLAVVVDDARAGVTEVLRGDDLFASAARQWHLQSALGVPHPTWFHVPLVVDDSGRRLAKRADDLSLVELRQRGVDPRIIVEWVAETCGVQGTGRVSPSEVTAHFDLGRVPRHPMPASVALLERLLAGARAPSA